MIRKRLLSKTELWGGNLGDKVILYNNKLTAVSPEDFYKYPSDTQEIGEVYIPISDNVYGTQEVGILSTEEGTGIVDKTGTPIWYSYTDKLQFCTSESVDNSILSPVQDLNNDFAGKEHTARVIQSIQDEAWKTDTSISTPYPAYTACWRRQVDGFTRGDWYLPSTGECKYLQDYLSLNWSLKSICSSVADNKDTIWYTVNDSKEIVSNQTSGYCIPVTRAKLTKSPNPSKEYFHMTATISGEGENIGWYRDYEYPTPQFSCTSIYEDKKHILKLYDPEPEIDFGFLTYGTVYICQGADCDERAYVTGDIKVAIEKGRARALRELFYNTYRITSIDMDFGDCSLLTDITDMFHTSNNVKSLTIRNLDTSHLTDIKDSFKVNAWYENNQSDTAVPLETLSCSQEVKDWCLANAETIGLPAAFRDSNYSGWKII